MKKLIAPILICTVLLTACHNNKPAENAEETTVETTIETTVETTAEITIETTVEETESTVETSIETTVETESTEPVETNLDGALEIEPGDDLTTDYWICVTESDQIVWEFEPHNNWSHIEVGADANSIIVPGYTASTSRFDYVQMTTLYDVTYDYHVYEDGTLYAYKRDGSELTGDCKVYSYSVDGDTLTLTHLFDIGPDGTIYEENYPETATTVYIRQSDGDSEY